MLFTKTTVNLQKIETEIWDDCQELSLMCTQLFPPKPPVMQIKSYLKKGITIQVRKNSQITELVKRHDFWFPTVLIFFCNMVIISSGFYNILLN